jgi:hypothetical protein
MDRFPRRVMRAPLGAKTETLRVDEYEDMQLLFIPFYTFKWVAWLALPKPFDS